MASSGVRERLLIITSSPINPSDSSSEEKRAANSL